MSVKKNQPWFSRSNTYSHSAVVHCRPGKMESNSADFFEYRIIHVLPLGPWPLPLHPVSPLYIIIHLIFTTNLKNRHHSTKKLGHRNMKETPQGHTANELKTWCFIQAVWLQSGFSCSEICYICPSFYSVSTSAADSINTCYQQDPEYLYIIS